MFPVTMMSPLNTYAQNEYANLVEQYQNVSLQVKYLQEIIKNLELKIQELENKQEPKKTKVYKRCKFYNTGFCRNRDNCLFQHAENICQEHLETGKCDRFRTCLHRHPRECRYFSGDQNCFHGNSCAYLHSEVVISEESSDNKVVSIDSAKKVTAKKVTIEVDGKIFSVENINDLDEDTVNAMTADDFLKFCDDVEIEKASEMDENEYVDLDQIEYELRHSVYLNATEDIEKEKTNSKSVKNLSLKKSTRKKSSSVKD